MSAIEDQINEPVSNDPIPKCPMCGFTVIGTIEDGERTGYYVCESCEYSAFISHHRELCARLALHNDEMLQTLRTNRALAELNKRLAEQVHALYMAKANLLRELGR